jgi:peptide deformylase
MYPNEVLRKKMPEVKSVVEILADIKDLKEVLAVSENGAGLAAPQLGIEKRLFVLKVDKKFEMFVNPKIVATYGNKVYPLMVAEGEKDEYFLEGCLSFPDLFGIVKRYLKIEAVWQDVVGQKLVSKRKIMTGFEAIVFQHELDHLDGILFIDHIKRDGGELYKFIKDKKIKWSIDKVVTEEK